MKQMGVSESDMKQHYDALEEMQKCLEEMKITSIIPDTVDKLEEQIAIQVII